MTAIISALNRAYEVKETRPWWKARLVAIGRMLALVLLMSSALVLLLYGPKLAEESFRKGKRRKQRNRMENEPLTLLLPSHG
jgi:uncharacterized BrkB/YihY/UPF0761 family membrane protein